MRHSITMLCWLFYDSGKGPVFRYRGSASSVNANRRVRLGITERKISFLFRNKDDSIKHTLSHSIELAGMRWKFVGASYDHFSGEAKLWVDGDGVEAKNIGAGHELATQGNVRMGRNLDIKITQMHVFNFTSTREQIQIILKRTQIAG